jgi:hypothetical protein
MFACHFRVAACIRVHKSFRGIGVSSPVDNGDSGRVVPAWRDSLNGKYTVFASTSYRRLVYFLKTAYFDIENSPETFMHPTKQSGKRGGLSKKANRVESAARGSFAY